MAKKEPNIADLLSAMKKNQQNEMSRDHQEANNAHADAVAIKGSMDNLNRSFSSALGERLDQMAMERSPFETVDLLDQIRLGVDGMKLSLGQRFRRFFTNFLGLMPSLAARKAAREADLATKLVAIDTRSIAESALAQLDAMREQNGLSKIATDRDERRAKAIFGAKGFWGKQFSRMGGAFSFLTRSGGKAKEKENEERRHKSRHITLLEAILKALGGQAEEEGPEDGGRPKGRWARWASALKKLALIGGILIGLAIAPFIFFSSFVKQLGVETKAIGSWIKKTARWGKGTFFDPIKNAFNRIMKVGGWADEFKKSFDTKWKNFKARFTPSGLIGIFNRLKMRLNAMKIGVNTAVDDALKAFQKSKVGANVSGVFSNLRGKWSNALSKLTASTNAAAGARGRPPGRTAPNPFQALRSSFSTAQANMTSRIAGWSQAFSKSPIVQKLGTMFNALKAPFIAVQEFLQGKKAARPAGMPPMLAAPSGGGGIMKVVSGISNFFRTVGGKIMKIPGVSLVTKPAAFLGRMFGKLFWPITAIFAIFDGVKQWKTDEGFSEETKPKTIMGKIRASVTRALANLVGMFLDMPKQLITWILDKAGLGKETVVVAGRELKQDAPWMQKLKAFNFSDLLFGFIWKIGSIPGQIISFIGDLISDPLGTIKGIFNSQWVKDHIWDSGQQAKPGPKGATGSPMRLFGIPLVMPSFPDIKWPDWGALFKAYIYDGDPQDGSSVKIFGVSLTFPSLPDDFSLLDILPDWLRNPKEFFSDWFKGVKSFFGFGEEDSFDAMKEEMAANQAIIDRLLAKEKSGATEASILEHGTKGLKGLKMGRGGGEAAKLVQAVKDNQKLAQNIEDMKVGTNTSLGVTLVNSAGQEILSRDFLRNGALAGSLAVMSGGAMAGAGGGNLAVDSSVSNTAVSVTVPATVTDTTTVIQSQYPGGPFSNLF